MSRFAGQTVRLQLESHPGPKNDTGWDESYWAEPTLVAGPPAAGRISADRRAGSRRWARCSGEGRRSTKSASGPAGAACSSRIGIGFAAGPDQLDLFRGFEVRVLGTALDDPRSPIVLQEDREEPSAERLPGAARFAGPAAAFDLVGRVWLQSGALRAKFHLENAPPPQPWHVVHLEEVAVGPWNATAEQVYAGQGNVIREPEAFRLGFDGHRLATSFVGFDFAGGPSLVHGLRPAARPAGGAARRSATIRCTCRTRRRCRSSLRRACGMA